MIHFAHGSEWVFDSARQVVMIGPLTVGVSSPRVAEPGTWWLKRIDESTWEIAPHRFGSESLTPHPIKNAWGYAAAVLLGAPASVSEELERL